MRKNIENAFLIKITKNLKLFYIYGRWSTTDVKKVFTCFVNFIRNTFQCSTARYPGHHILGWTCLLAQADTVVDDARPWNARQLMWAQASVLEHACARLHEMMDPEPRARALSFLCICCSDMCAYKYVLFVYIWAYALKTACSQSIRINLVLFEDNVLRGRHRHLDYTPIIV